MEDFKHKCKQHFKSLLTFYNIKNKHLFFKNKTKRHAKTGRIFTTCTEKKYHSYVKKKKPLTKNNGSDRNKHFVLIRILSNYI